MNILVSKERLQLVLSLATANEHLISPMLADRVPTYVDFITTLQNETIQLICIVILFSYLYTPFTMSYLYFYFGCLCIVKYTDPFKIISKLKDFSVIGEVASVTTALTATRDMIGC